MFEDHIIYVALEEVSYLINSVESFNIVQDGIVKAALLHLLAALLRLVQSFLRSRVAEILGTAVPQIMKIVRLADPQFCAQISRRASAHHVEHVVIPLVRTLQAHPGLLQQVMGDVTADYLTLAIEVHLHEFAEARTIVVALRLRVAKRLQHRSCCGLIAIRNTSQSNSNLLNHDTG